VTRTTSLRCEVEIICDSIAAWYALHHAFTGRLSLGVDTTAQAALRAPDWRRCDTAVIVEPGTRSGTANGAR